MALVLVLSMAGCSYLQTVRDETQQKEMMESRECFSKIDDDPAKLEALKPYLIYGSPVIGSDSLTGNELKCYCRELSKTDALTALFTFESGCFDFFVGDIAPQIGLNFAASLGITVVNIILWYVASILSRFEKHHSLINEEYSVMRRMFIAMTVNTVFILLLVNLRFVKDNSQFLADFSGIGSGKYRDITFEWYKDVGTEITTSVALTIVAPHSARLFWWFLTWVRRHCTSRARHYFSFGMGRFASSQRALNELFLGPKFRLSSRIPQMLVPIFATMTYGAGMPILYLICCLTFGVFFWVEKFLLLRYYRLPPRFGPELLNWAANMMFYAILWHIVFAVWMLSTPHIFDDGSAEAEKESLSPLFEFAFSYVPSMSKSPFWYRVTRAQTFPLVIIGCLITVGKVMDKTFKWVGKAKAAAFSFLTCGVLDSYKKKRVYLNPPLRIVKKNGDLVGLHSYSIHRNPLFMHAFSAGASSHLNRSVESTRNLADEFLPRLPGNSEQRISTEVLNLSDAPQYSNPMHQR